MYTYYSLIFGGAFFFFAMADEAVELLRDEYLAADQAFRDADANAAAAVTEALDNPSVATKRKAKEASTLRNAAVVARDDAHRRLMAAQQDLINEHTQRLKDAEEAGTAERVRLQEKIEEVRRQSVPPQPQAGGGVNATGVQGSQLSVIPVFTGEPPYDVESWIATVERCKTQFAWTDHQMAAVVKNKLTGAAAIWLRATEKLNPRHFNVWAADPQGLKHQFLAKFLPAKTEQAAILAVSHLKQRSNESCSDFFDRVVLAVDKVNHHVPDGDKQTLNYQTIFKTQVRTFFGAGLKDEIRTLILASNSPPTTMEELRDQAVASETQLRNKNPTMKDLEETAVTSADPNPLPQKEQENSPVLREVQELAKKVEALSTSFNNRGRGGGRGRGGRGQGRGKGRDLSKVTCFKCENKGHYANRCPSGRGTGRGQRGMNRQDTTRRGDQGSQHSKQYDCMYVEEEGDQDQGN